MTKAHSQEWAFFASPLWNNPYAKHRVQVHSASDSWPAHLDARRAT